MGGVAAGLVVGLGSTVLRRTYSRFEIAEHSMSPALVPGDFVIVSRADAPRRGDIIVFPHPDRPAFHLVKRVVAIGNEQVAIANGQVHVDGNVLAEPWADGPTLGDGHWHLSPTEVFVLGDRRSESRDDGRAIGPLPAAAVTGRVVARYWPLHRLGRIERR